MYTMIFNLGSKVSLLCYKKTRFEKIEILVFRKILRIPSFNINNDLDLLSIVPNLTPNMLLMTVVLDSSLMSVSIFYLNAGFY